MRGSNPKILLTPLFRSALKNSDPTTSTPHFQTLETRAFSSARKQLKRRDKFSPKKPPPKPCKFSPKKPPPKPSSTNSKSLIAILQESQNRTNDESGVNVLEDMASMLGGSREKEAQKEEVVQVKKVINIPWFSTTPKPITLEQQFPYKMLESKEVNQHALEQSKVVSRARKEKWVFKNNQNSRFHKVINLCSAKIGADSTVRFLGSLKRATGPKEYRALIQACVDKARKSQDKEEYADHIHKAYQLFEEMKEQGFPINEDFYGPLLLYLIDMKLADEFFIYCEVIKEGNSSTIPRLGYYEMMFWIKVYDNDKIQELCDSVLLDGDTFDLAGSYLLALCETDRKKQLLQLLEVVDVSKMSSRDQVSSIFKSIGRLSLEECVEKLIATLKTSDFEAENISYFICNYATNMPDQVVEDVIHKFENLHEKFDVRPSSMSYEKLVVYCCESLKVHEAFAIVEQMCQLEMPLPHQILCPIIYAVEDSCELDLVPSIYSVIRRHNLVPDNVALRTLINLFVKAKDFEGAYNMLSDMKDMNIRPTTSMYNAILAGYLREKRKGGKVLKEMKLANLKPDSQTFSYLIANAECEEDIDKHFEELKSAKVRVTKYVYMALINGYMKIGQFDKAKQVVLNKEIPIQWRNEIKSALVSALACCGQMSDALGCYDEIKQDGHHLDPKAVISLIEHLQSEGELDRLLQLLEDLKVPDFWFDGCRRVVIYCIRHKHLSSSINLLKQLKDHDEMSTYAVLDQVFSEIFDIEPTDLHIGIDLLQAIKEELKFRPSRTSLDFLLSACVSGKDPLSAALVWEEYQKAGLPYNVLSYMRMYQVHLACGEIKDAKKILKYIPKNDPHVRGVIKACQDAFSNSKSTKKMMQMT